MRKPLLCALLLMTSAAPAYAADSDMAAPPAQEMAAPPATQEMAAPPAIPVTQVEGQAEDIVQWDTPPEYKVAQADTGKEEAAKKEDKKEEAVKEAPAAATPAEAPKDEAKPEEKPEEKAEAPAAAAEAPVAAAEKPPVHKASSVMVPLPRPMIPGVTLPDDAEIPIVDTDETLPLPPYPPGALTAMGEEKMYTLGEEDTLLDVARYFKLGFVELRAANPKIDSWTPVPGDEIVIPHFKLLPRAEQKGIVVNLAQMRMYIFSTPGKPPVTFPIGIGREGLQTPMGQTTIVRKVAGPVWHPTKRMKEEKPYLPDAIPPGNQNPLGSHALYLGWPEYLIHGTNKPWAIGRRVSSGCMRLYPEDTRALYGMIPVGTKVTVVDQPILVAWVGDKLYLEADPSKSQSNDIEINGDHEEKDLTDATRKVITDAAGVSADRIDWDTVETVMKERRGVPVVISGGGKDEDAAEDKPVKKAPTHPPAKFRYN